MGYCFFLSSGPGFLPVFPAAPAAHKPRHIGTKCGDWLMLL